MTLPERLDLYRAVIARLGTARQVVKIMEETGEVLAAFARFLYGVGTRADLCSEIADVTIMLEQLALIAGIPPGAVAREVDRKLARLRARLDTGTLR